MARVFAVAGTAVFALLAFCETPRNHKQGMPTVGVVLDFDSVPGKSSVDEMNREVDALLKPSGVTVDWRVAGENHGFKGKCKAENWSQEGESSTFARGDTQKALGPAVVSVASC